MSQIFHLVLPLKVAILFTTRADDSHASPVYHSRRRSTFIDRAGTCQTQVRSFALYRIKPHAPPVVRSPVNSFEF